MKLYVVIRKDLSPAQQAVQAGHALAQFMLDYPGQAAHWRNRTLIYLGVSDERQLGILAQSLNHLRKPVSRFHEPDIGNSLTAIATTFRLPQFDGLRLCRFQSPRPRTMRPFRVVS